MGNYHSEIGECRELRRKATYGINEVISVLNVEHNLLKGYGDLFNRILNLYNITVKQIEQIILNTTNPNLNEDGRRLLVDRVRELVDINSPATLNGNMPRGARDIQNFLYHMNEQYNAFLSSLDEVLKFVPVIERFKKKATGSQYLLLENATILIDTWGDFLLDLGVNQPQVKLLLDDIINKNNLNNLRAYLTYRANQRADKVEHQMIVE